MKPSEYKIRKTWDINPIQRPHSTRKGKKGFSRSSRRQMNIQISKEY